MPKISSIIATLLLGLLVWKASLWNTLPPSEKTWTGLAGIYAIVMAGAGWGYAALNLKALGWIHALLMLGVAGTSGYFGFAVLQNHSIAGGSGPDANPVGGILYGIGFLYCVLAITTAFCGVGVVTNILAREKEEKADPH